MAQGLSFTLYPSTTTNVSHHRNIVGATYMLGMLVGSFALGYVSDKYGR